MIVEEIFIAFAIASYARLFTLTRRRQEQQLKLFLGLWHLAAAKKTTQRCFMKKSFEQAIGHGVL